MNSIFDHNPETFDRRSLRPAGRTFGRLAAALFLCLLGLGLAACSDDDKKTSVDAERDQASRQAIMPENPTQTSGSAVAGNEAGSELSARGQADSPSGTSTAESSGQSAPAGNSARELSSGAELAYGDSSSQAGQAGQTGQTGGSAAADQSGRADQAAQTSDQPSGVVHPVNTSFHDFVLVNRVGENGTHTADVLFKDRELPMTAESLKTVQPTPVQESFPQQNCETVKVDLFTGGANCCFGYYLLSSCSDGHEYAGYVEPFDGSLSDLPQTVSGALRGYTANDPAFMYYEVADALTQTPAALAESMSAENPGELDMSLSRVESPRPQRFIIFDNGTWRADKPGEFRAAYEDLLKQARADMTGNDAGRAILSAYYGLMAGNDSSIVAENLRSDLPERYSVLTPKIMTDLEKAVRDFNPVRNIDLK